MTETFPMKPNDWVADAQDRIARVIRVYRLDGDAVYLDLSIYNHAGDRVGRESPAVGGPKTFEPACSADDWERINKPSFPISLKWVDSGRGDGSRIARMYAGERLPRLNWVPPVKKPKKASVRVEADYVPPPVILFTQEELEHLRDLVAGANHPLSISIGGKAINQLDRITKALQPNV